MILNVLLFILAILKFVFFAILAIIGIILLIVLILCAIILFTPIRHNITFRLKEGFLYFHMKVYVIKKIQADIYFRNGKFEVITSFEKKEADKREQKKKKLPKGDTKKKGNSEPNKALNRNEVLPKKEICNELSTEQVREYEAKEGSEETTETAVEREQEHRDDANLSKADDSCDTHKPSVEVSKPSSKDTRSTKESKRNTKRDNRQVKRNNREKQRSKEVNKKSKNKPKDINEWILFIQEKIEKALWFLECYGTEKIFMWLKKSFKGFLTIFHLDTAVFYGVYGNTSDPKFLGQLLGWFYTLKGVFYLKNFTLVGDFEKDVYDFTFYSKGKIQLYKIIFPVVALSYYVLKASIKAFEIDFKYVVNLVKSKLKKAKKKKV